MQSITRRNGVSFAPWSDLFNMRRDMMGDLFETFGTPRATADNVIWAPPVNVREDHDNVHVELELPGVNPDDVDISLEGRMLTVAGEKRHERRDENESWHVFERRYGRFERSFTVDRHVNADAIQARYMNGVLHITLPKAEEAKPRRIRITAGGDQQATGRDVGTQAS
jgi:HSP20 family protein